MTHLAQKTHALLFAEGGGLTYTALKKALSCTDQELASAVHELEQLLAGSGLQVVRSDSEVALAISPEARETVVAKAHNEMSNTIGDAGLEVLSVLLYEGPSTRADIDYIRGVNSSSTIRNLLTRGLIERTGNPSDAREYLYRPTLELMAHLGIAERGELPDYATISRELSTFKAQPRDGAFGSSNHESGPTNTT